MSRSLTNTFLAALNQGQTSEIYHTLIVLSGGGITTRRYVNNYEDVTSGGDTYTAAAFDARLPDDVEDRIPDVNIVIDNVDRVLMEDIRSATSAPDITLSVVLQSDPNTVEVGPFSFKIRAVDYNALAISGTLKYEDILNEAFPKVSYTPLTFPGLF